MIRLSKQAFQGALKLAETQAPYPYRLLLLREGERVVHDLLDQGFLIDGPILEYWPDGEDEDGNDRFAKIHWSPEHQQHQCILTHRGLVSLDPLQPATFSLNYDRWVQWVAQLLAIPSAQPITTIVDRVLWDLGGLWIGKQRFPCLLGIGSDVDTLLDALESYTQPHPIVLTPFALPLSRHTLIPHQPYLMDLNQLIDDQSRPLRLNRDKLMTLTAPPQPPKKLGAVTWVENASHTEGYLTIYDITYPFKGTIRCHIIRQLVEAWAKGIPKLRTDTVLATAGSSSQQISNALGYPQTWKKVVGYGGGDCWLIVPKK